MTATLRSKDGTPIAFEVEGDGPPVILVDGALTTRRSGSKPELARLLAQHFTVYLYDRRGRGESGDTMPYAVEREIEDIDALVVDAGGSAALYGHSSGACLAMEASIALGARVVALAMYEAPYNNDAGARQAWHEYLEQLAEALASGRRGDAIALFMAYVGIPAAEIEGMRRAPFWAGMEALAATLAYDHTGIMGKDASIPKEQVARVSVPTLVMCGGNGAPFMGETARTLTEAIPGAQMTILEGQAHDVQPEALAPVLVGFFAP
jgi:pimeloyl-ACP methyl ester carboxylesterase